MTVGKFIAGFGVPLVFAVIAMGVVAYLLLGDLGRRDTDARSKARTDLILGRPGQHRGRFGLRGPEAPEAPDAVDAKKTRPGGDDR